MVCSGCCYGLEIYNAGSTGGVRYNQYRYIGYVTVTVIICLFVSSAYAHYSIVISTYTSYHI